MKYIDGGQLVRIALVLGCLIAVIVMKSRCGGAMSSMFRTLDAPTVASASDGGQRD